MNDRVNLASLLSVTVDEIQQSWQVILIYSALILVISAAMFGVIGATENGFIGSDVWNVFRSRAATGSTVIIGALAAVAFQILASFYLLAGMFHRSTSPSFDTLLPFIGITILSWLVIGIGFLLLIIPGIIFIVRLTPLLPIVLSQEGPSFDAFGKSWDMTDGRGWSIFGAYVILYIALLVVSGIMTGLSALLGPWGMVLAEGFQTLLSSIIFTALSVGAYRLMIDDTQDLSQIFE
ncbi:glycerophosphoryl diester phosphodiesterase membrane domain-containing protein [Erythrobacter sp. Alg231-14]|uniref:glycerophosphoryl diester phosphodiesterase membrane domain-containing protein n=1 Tax=Erythrobacter sp. Alg231-14 TaxID=1922225 RepID=UPI000D55A1D6